MKKLLIRMMLQRFSDLETELYITTNLKHSEIKKKAFEIVLDEFLTEHTSVFTVDRKFKDNKDAVNHGIDCAKRHLGEHVIKRQKKEYHSQKYDQLGNLEMKFHLVTCDYREFV